MKNEAINLEKSKKRGRPATGTAASNAERQRAYRERQKEQRNAKGEYTREQVQNAIQEYQDIISQLQKQLTEAKKALEDIIKDRNYWINRAEGAENELKKAEFASHNENKMFYIESRKAGGRKWTRIDKFADREEFCKKFIEKTIKDGSTLKYRMVPA